MTSQRPSRGGRVEQQVGEAEVGQHPPLGHEPLEVDDVGPLEVRVLPSEVREGGHGLPVCPPGAGRPGSAPAALAEPDQAGEVVDGSSRIGTVTRTSAVVASSARCSASRVGHDRRSWRSSRRPRRAPGRTRVVGPSTSPATASASSAASSRQARRRSPRRPSRSRYVGQHLVQHQRAEVAACAAAARPTKNSASWTGAASSVVTTHERRAPVVQQPRDLRGPARRSPSTSTGRAGRTRRCPGGTGAEDPVGHRVEGLATPASTTPAAVRARSASAAAGRRRTRPCAPGASRKSIAFRVGGVSTTIRS